MPSKITRHDFLRLSLLSLGAMAFRGLPHEFPQLPPEDQVRIPIALGRVGADYINIYKAASFKSEQLGRYTKDTFVPLLSRVQTSLSWKGANPYWYRTSEGFIHSGHIQRFTNKYNEPAQSIPESGQLGEVTIGYTQGHRYLRYEGWKPFYRLYYQTVHWITDIVEGPTSSQPYYQITDERLRVRYVVPAKHVRLIQSNELTPISPNVPADEKHLQVSIGNQTLTAFEGDQPVFHTLVSTGRHTDGPTVNGIPTDTPLGRFYIGNKMPSRHMGDGSLDSDIYAYELPGVPWNMFFVSTGVAFHGAYWHDNFGYRMSAGCVNLRPEDAKWLYRWTTPVLEPGEWHHYERGTKIDVIA
jgi:lipoprotein-anchoring transpeptidase ErfK/SrfK